MRNFSQISLREHNKDGQKPMGAIEARGQAKGLGALKREGIDGPKHWRRKDSS